MKLSTKDMINKLPHKFNVFYTLPSGRSKTETGITKKRLNTILSNEYRFYGVVVSVGDIQYHEQSEYYGDSLLWEVL